jgi:hypothetical protein
LLYQDFADYCRNFYNILKHPFYLYKEEKIDEEKLEEALTLFEYILDKHVSVNRLQNIKERFISAFEKYLYTSRIEIGALCNNIEKLSSILDPFLKKLCFLFYPDLNFQKGTKSIPLWHTSNFSDILKELAICTCDLKNSSFVYWYKQNCKQAMLRIAFVSRHKSVHESYRYNLVELERIAYSVIGTYIIACVKILEDNKIRNKFSNMILQGKLIRLLKYKTEAFDTTTSLLSKEEFLNIYLFRENIILDEKEINFLFLNYFAENGPIFFWLKNISKKVLVEWAKSYIEKEFSNKIIKKNVIRYLVKNGESFEFKLLNNTFNYYEEKEELAHYIQKFAKLRDLDILFKLYLRSKAEEIVEASAEVLSKIIREENQIYALIQSKSEKKRILLEKIIRELADKSKLFYYRNFINIKDQLKQIYLIYLLGEVGEKDDIYLIKNWLLERRSNKKITYVARYAITRIACKTKNYILVKKLIHTNRKILKDASLNAITRYGLNGKVKEIINLNIEKSVQNQVLARISNYEDLPIIKECLKGIKLNNIARPLILTICKYGGSEEFDFLLQLFLAYSDDIEFYNHVRIATEMGNLCNRNIHLKKLKKIISSPDFWSYLKDNRPANKINIKKYENLPLVRRIVAYGFSKIASNREKNLLRKLLEHYYSWISHISMACFVKFSNKNDLKLLIKYSLDNINDFEEEKTGNLIKVICAIDEKIYAN